MKRSAAAADKKYLAAFTMPDCFVDAVREAIRREDDARVQHLQPDRGEGEAEICARLLANPDNVVGTAGSNDNDNYTYLARALPPGAEGFLIYSPEFVGTASKSTMKGVRIGAGYANSAVMPVKVAKSKTKAAHLREFDIGQSTPEHICVAAAVIGNDNTFWGKGHKPSSGASGMGKMGTWEAVAAVSADKRRGETVLDILERVLAHKKSGWNPEHVVALKAGVLGTWLHVVSDPGGMQRTMHPISPRLRSQISELTKDSGSHKLVAALLADLAVCGTELDPDAPCEHAEGQCTGCPTPDQVLAVEDMGGAEDVADENGTEGWEKVELKGLPKVSVETLEAYMSSNKTEAAPDLDGNSSDAGDDDRATANADKVVRDGLERANHGAGMIDNSFRCQFDKDAKTVAVSAQVPSSQGRGYYFPTVTLECTDGSLDVAARIVPGKSPCQYPCVKRGCKNRCRHRASMIWRLIAGTLSKLNGHRTSMKNPWQGHQACAERPKNRAVRIRYLCNRRRGGPSVEDMRAFQAGRLSGAARRKRKIQTAGALSSLRALEASVAQSVQTMVFDPAALRVLEDCYGFHTRATRRRDLDPAALAASAHGVMVRVPDFVAYESGTHDPYGNDLLGESA